MTTETLIEAVEFGSLNRIQDLVSFGVDINSRNRVGETALIRAARTGQLEIVKYLLENGADVNASRSDGLTPLISASFFGHKEVVEALLNKGADKNIKDRVGLTAGGWAQTKGHTSIQQLLAETFLDTLYLSPIEEIRTFSTQSDLQSSSFIKETLVPTAMLGPYLDRSTVSIPTNHESIIWPGLVLFLSILIASGYLCLLPL
jgi:uncharacterized protein